MYGYGDYENTLDNLVGKTVEKIYWSEERLVIVTDDGTFAYDVEGDCCSSSYFHDFFGVRNLLDNGPIISVGDVNLHDDDPRFSSPVTPQDEDSYSDESIQVYGYEFVTSHPVFGEMTSVLSFRNSSNGYYGGWMDRVEGEFAIPEDALELSGDYIG